MTTIPQQKTIKIDGQTYTKRLVLKIKELNNAGNLYINDSTEAHINNDGQVIINTINNTKIVELV